MTLIQIAIKNVRRRMSRSVIAVVGLVIGVATVVTLISIVDSMKLEMTKQMNELGANMVIMADAGELTFSYGGIAVPEVLYDVQKLTVDDVQTVRQLELQHVFRVVAPRLLGVASAGQQQVVIAGIDPNAEFVMKPWLQLQEQQSEPNSDPEVLELSGNEVMVGAIAAANLKIATQDVLSLNGHEFKIVGILQENGSPEDLQVLMPINMAQNLLNLPHEITVIELAADYSSVSEKVVLEQLEDALPHAKIIGLRQAVLGRDIVLARLTHFGTAVSFLVLLIGMLVVAITMSSAVRQRSHEIGILRALGFRRKHIAQIIAMEAVLISVVGGILGFFSGILLARASGPLLSGISSPVPWRIDLFAVAIVIAVFVGLFASLLPMHQAARLDPADALRG